MSMSNVSMMLEVLLPESMRCLLEGESMGGLILESSWFGESSLFRVWPICYLSWHSGPRF